MSEPTPYETVIIETFARLCKEQGGASPAEVFRAMSEAGTVAKLDTNLHIPDQMYALRARGLL